MPLNLESPALENVMCTEPSTAADHTMLDKHLIVLLVASRYSSVVILMAANCRPGDFNLGHDEAWEPLEEYEYQGVLDRGTATNTSSTAHYDNIYCMGRVRLPAAEVFVCHTAGPVTPTARGTHQQLQLPVTSLRLS